MAVLLPAVVWRALCAGTLADKRTDGGDLTVVSHNVNEHTPRPVHTARAPAASGADVVTLQEPGGSAVSEYADALAATYRHHSVRGTVGRWSRYPIAGAQTPRHRALTARPARLRAYA